MQQAAPAPGTIATLCLVRHGETDWNSAGRIQGHTDVPLNERGRQQAREVAARLAAVSWDALYASTLARAWQTAELIGHSVGLAPRGDSGLWERHCGVLEQQTWEAVRSRFPWIRSLSDTGIPGAETDPVLVARVRGALHRIAGRHRGQCVLVVTHGGVIGACLRELCRPAVPVERIDNCGTFTLHYVGLGRLQPAKRQEGSA